MTRRGTCVLVVVALLAAGEEAAAADSSPGPPDLVVRSVAGPRGTAFIGARVPVRAVLANTGTGSAPESSARFYLSRGTSWSSADVPLATARARRLRVHGKLTIATRLRIPAAAPRLEPLHVLACADANLRISERNESNNCKTMAGTLVIAGRTSFDAIDADLRAHRITSAQALVDKLFAGFGDRRLPKRYRFPGATGGSLTAVTGEAVQRFASLPAKTKAIVRPFLIPPAYPGSYRAGSPKTRQTLDSCTVRIPAWHPVDVNVGAGSSAGGAIIWWNASRPGDEARANALAGELAGTIWPVLTALMRTTPISDAGHACAGSDGRLDIYLDPIPDPVTSQFSAGCGPEPSDIILPATASRGVLAHEFMHVLQKTYQRLSPCTQFEYIDDATATWAEDYVYPKDNTEHHYAQMLQYPDIRFNYPPTAGYPAWVLFRSVSERVGADVVPAFYTAAETEKPFDALDSSLPGGLDESWPQFARDGWNQPLPPALTASFFKWDAFGVVPEEPKISYALSGKRTTFPLPIQMAGIGRQYQHIDLSDDAAKLVTFVDPGPSDIDPGLRTYAYYRLADGTWKGADWTGRDKVEFCRDTEDVREVILVHSTSTRPKNADGSGFVVKTSKPKLVLADKCDPNASFDVTSVSGGFSWSLQEQENQVACTDHRSVDWQSTLAPGNPPAELHVFYDMNGEHPEYTFSTPAGGVYLTATGNGVATRECSMPPPGSNGSVRCDIHVTRGQILAIGGEQQSPGPTIKLEWNFGYPGITYDPGHGMGGNGGSCVYGGSAPPSLGPDYTGTLDVSSLNDGSNLGAPIGTTTASIASFGENTVTLTFSGSNGGSFASDLSSGTAGFSWSMTATFTRR